MDTTSKQSLLKREAELKSKQARLQAELYKKYNRDVFRELNIVSHNLEVCRQRIKGEWKCPDVEVRSNVNLLF